MNNQNNLKLLYFSRAGIIIASLIFFFCTDVYNMLGKGITGHSLFTYYEDYADEDLGPILGVIFLSFIVLPIGYTLYKKDWYIAGTSMILVAISFIAIRTTMFPEVGHLLSPSIGLYLYILCGFLSLVISIIIQMFFNKRGDNFNAIRITESKKRIAGLIFLEDNNLVFEENVINKGNEILTPLTDIAKVIKTKRGIIIYAKGVPFEFKMNKVVENFIPILEKRRKEAAASSPVAIRELIKEGC